MLAHSQLSSHKDPERLTLTINSLTAHINNLKPLLELAENKQNLLRLILSIINNLVRIKTYYELILNMLTLSPMAFTKILENEFYVLSKEERARVNPSMFNYDFFLAVDKFLRTYLCVHIGYFCLPENRKLFEDWKIIKSDLRFLVK